MRLASSGEESEWANTSATKSIRFWTCIVTMDQSLALGIYFGMTAEIGGANGFVAPQLVGLAAQHNEAGFQDVAMVGHRKPHARILLDKQYRRILPDFRDNPEHRLHDNRRKAERWLVQQQQPRLRHQATRHRDHLQLATRQGPAERIGKRPDIRKQIEHCVRFARKLGFRDPAVRRAEHDVFLHRQTWENPSPFGHVGDAEPDNGLRPEASDRPAICLLYTSPSPRD